MYELVRLSAFSRLRSDISKLSLPFLRSGLFLRSWSGSWRRSSLQNQAHQRLRAQGNIIVLDFALVGIRLGAE